MASLVSQAIEKEAKEVAKEVKVGVEALGYSVGATVEIGCCVLSTIDTVKAIKNGKPLMALANVCSAICCFAGYMWFGKEAEKAYIKYAKIK